MALMNCVFLRVSALMRWENVWMTLKLCSIDIIRLICRVIVSVSPACIFEPLAIFFGSP